MDVFARGQDNALWTRWYDGRWNDWARLGGSLTSPPAAASPGPGRLSVFARGDDGALWARDLDGGWGDWYSLGGDLR
jgi:hypothetical protein